MTKKFIEDREYELNLILQAKKGDYENTKEAMEKLLNYHQGLIYSLAYKFTALFQTEELDDLVQEFSIFFMRCVEKYNIENNSGAKLSTYYRSAVYFNVWKLYNERRSLVIIPNHLREVAAKIIKIKKELLNEFGEPATKEQVFEKIGISSELGESFRSIFSAYYVSLDTPIGPDDERLVGELISNPVDQEQENLQRIFNEEVSETILSVLGGTNPTVKVFVQKFLAGISMEQIIAEMKLPFDEVEKIWRILRQLPKKYPALSALKNY